MHKNQSGFALVQIILAILAGTLFLGGTVSSILYLAKSEIKNPGTLQQSQQMAVASQTQPFLQSQSRCGDGVCDAAEKANSNLCPKDCQQTQPSTIQSSVAQSTSNSTKSAQKDSPFALQAPFMTRAKDKGYISNEEATNLLLDAGIKEVRLVLPELEKYNIQDLLTKNNIAISADIAPPVYPKDMEKYKSEVKASVKKYKNNVEAWIVVNEAETGWKDTPEKYAEYFIATSKAIKSEAPDAVVVLNLAGTSADGTQASSVGLKFLETALKNGVGPYFDVLDIHIQGVATNYKNLGKIVSAYNKVFKQNGVKEKPIWNTEFGTYDGYPDENPKLPWMKLSYQSEAVQASGLLKKYVYGLSVGIKKMFWTTMTEWSHYNEGRGGNCYFCSTGLVNNSRNDNGLADIKSTKKLSYYTYKKMVEVLDGSNWNNIQTIQEKDGVYVYKFTKAGKPIWVAWNDNSVGKQIVISGINAGSVKVTEAIPKYESGKEVTDYNKAFNTETKTVSGGKVTLILKDKPVFVETSQVVTTKTTTTSTTAPKTKNTVSTKSVSKDSPFGVFGPYITNNEDNPTGISKTDVSNYLKDIGVGWVEEMPKNSDLEELSKSGVSLYSRVGVSADKTRALVKKYKDTVKYWEAATEPNGVGGWANNPAGYVAFLKEQYTAIKKECPDCYLVPGGLPGVGTGLTADSSSAKFLREVLQFGGGKYYEVFEFKQHAWNANEYRELKNKMEVYGKIFAGFNMDIKKMPVFIETATHDGSAVSVTKKEVLQSETTQALGLVKIYIYALAQGIDKVFWNLMVERHNFGNDANSSFNFYGLVNNPDNDGLFHKKLAYYTYKKMVEVLDGSDWSNIQTIQEKDGVYIYKFTKASKPIWVAWNDNSGSKQATISGITASSVKVNEAIPKYESGKEVTNYSTAFNTEMKTVSGGGITITLGDKPVFVE